MSHDAPPIWEPWPDEDAIPSLQATPDEPTPLPSGLPPVPPLPFKALPSAIRPWIEDIADRMQSPPDYVAAAALTAASSLVGARVVIRPKRLDSWREACNLWGLVVGRPGTMKTPCVDEALRPLKAIASAEEREFHATLNEWEIDAKVSKLAAEERERLARKLARKAAQTDLAKARELLAQRDETTGTEPRQRRFILCDPTVEKLGELLAEGSEDGHGVLLQRDELAGLLASFDRQGYEGARTFYLQSFNGMGSYTFDRIGRGKTHIPKLCLSLLGGIQPGRLQSYIRDAVRGSGGDDGLLQRFGLAVWPDTSTSFQYIDREPGMAAMQDSQAVFERLAKLRAQADGTPWERQFDAEAQALFVEWLTTFEEELRRGEMHDSLVSHLAKYRKLVPVLATLFALIDNEPENVSALSLNRAIVFAMEYLKPHAERLYSAATRPDVEGARLLLSRVKVDRNGIGGTFTPREIAKKGWTGLTTSDEVRKAADTLTDYGWLYQETVSTGGRPSDRYILHPSLLSHGPVGRQAEKPRSH
ncbi:YfjI family protein [Candidatus Symbiobacter mobilis]|uniref:DUF3987 domain-containing protein n=1 Tax=Candidatus Symbiobacter mobilis CR TaxID=946483 RepID=U5NCT2_9BURK|nr:YfjI family protein [Candidatus Symbiobacter mobilis]AGX88048.1 hypothetical protein Cenrod_1974 [Candidatus Symbiobacter mobilis CR]